MTLHSHHVGSSWFGHWFIQSIKMLFGDASTCITISGFQSLTFGLFKSIFQGRPLAPCMFWSLRALGILLLTLSLLGDSRESPCLFQHHSLPMAILQMILFLPSLNMSTMFGRLFNVLTLSRWALGQPFNGTKPSAIDYPFSQLLTRCSSIGESGQVVGKSFNFLVSLFLFKALLWTFGMRFLPKLRKCQFIGSPSYSLQPRNFRFTLRFLQPPMFITHHVCLISKLLTISLRSFLEIFYGPLWATTMVFANWLRSFVVYHRSLVDLGFFPPYFKVFLYVLNGSFMLFMIMRLGKSFFETIFLQGSLLIGLPRREWLSNPSHYERCYSY